MNFIDLFTESQIPEVANEFSKVIATGEKQPTKIVNRVLQNNLTKNFIMEAIGSHRPDAIEYVKSLMNAPVSTPTTTSVYSRPANNTADPIEPDNSLVLQTNLLDIIDSTDTPVDNVQLPEASITQSATIKIDPEFKSLIPELRHEELMQLHESLLHDGCRDPLVVWEDILLDGHNRYEICLKHNIQFNTVQIEGITDRDEAKMWIIRNQLGRRNLSDYDRGILALSFKTYFQARAKANQGKRTDIPQNSAECSPVVSVDTRKELERLSGLSHDTLSKIEKIESVKETKPDLINKIRSGDMTVNKVYLMLRQEENYQSKKQANLREYAQGKYDVILADPPWKYEKSGCRGSAEEHYPSMELQDICVLPVSDYTASNCVLFLWTTNPQLEAALQVIKAWGFKYKTNIVRIKKNYGPGSYVRSEHELLLIATKGSHITPEITTIGSVIQDPPDFKSEHSRKPYTYYKLIEDMYPDRRYIELFARSKRPNWDIFTNEVTLRAA